MKGFRYIGCARSASPCDFCNKTGEFQHKLCYAPLVRMTDESWTIPMTAEERMVCRECADTHICKQQKSVPGFAEVMLRRERYGVDGNWLSIWALNAEVLR